ncbi:MAG: hypothetical protein NVSMB19_00050 [Vulcanimicrobiaceae bacterium]
MVGALRNACPPAATALRFQEVADTARASGDAKSYQFYRDAARLFYRCATTVTEPELHDLALIAYAYNSNLSTRTNHDVIALNPVLNGQLTFRSTDPGLRATAHTLRRSIRLAYREAYKAVNGRYPAELPDPAKSEPRIPQFTGPTVVVTPEP